MTLPPPEANAVLARLPPAALSQMRPRLDPCELALRQTIYASGEPSAFAYFLGSGLASVLVGPERTVGSEVGVVGRDGMLGLPIVLRADRSPQTVFIQKEGSAWRISAADLRDAMSAHPELNDLLLRYAHCFLQQISATAYANAHFTVEERLARWLLMYLDRQDGPDVAVTHEFLALMLGVHRPGVTVATRTLESQGLIKAQRGLITVLDRTNLKRMAGNSYGLAEAEYTRLFGKK